MYYRWMLLFDPANNRPVESTYKRSYRAFQSTRYRTALLAPRRRSRLKPPNLPGFAASAANHASFRNRPAGSGVHAATREGQGCRAGPGGLKGRGRVDEARALKHRSGVVRKALRAFRDDERASLSRTTRSAAGPRESSLPRAFWVLLSPFLPTPNLQNHPFHRQTHVSRDTA